MALHAGPSAWFDLLAALGDLTFVTHVSGATLGWCGDAPRFDHTDWPVLPASRTWPYAPNLAEFARLWALREIDATGVRHLLAVQNTPGAVFHRIIVPPGPGSDRLLAFIERHQLPPDRTRPWFPPNHARAAERHACVHQRIPWLQSRWAARSPRIRRLSLVQTLDLLAAAVSHAQPLRTMLYSEPLICGTAWIPERIVAEPRPASPLPPSPHASRKLPWRLRLFGGASGLELLPHLIGSAWLWMDQCACCQRSRWAVEIGGIDDRLILALLATHDTTEPAWRRFLRTTLDG
ncbi:MAG: hypothetical protein KF833_16180 [Verrucomicrobiae bacterium]|nr:hypothetical protein [Verrucomicrobiae bacterium]